MTRLNGVIAPNVTPFHEDLTIDEGLYVAQAKALLAAGCAGLAPFGTTGEAASIGLRERMAALEALVGAGVDAARLMPGTGACALPDAIELTRHAVGLGCAGVMTLPPFYFKPVTDEGVFRAYAAVIEGVGDPRLRLYLYHIPQFTGVGLSVALVRRLADAFPGVVVGLKDSSGDWANTAAYLEACPDLAIYPGTELALRRSRAAGAAGCITATVNVNAAAIAALDAGLASGAADLAAAEARVDGLRKAITAKGAVVAPKALLARASGRPAFARVRPPLVALPEAEAAALEADLLRAFDFRAPVVG